MTTIRNLLNFEPTDPRYLHGTCSDCGRLFQFIDWGCALHQLLHNGSQPVLPAELWTEALAVAKRNEQAHDPR